MSHFLARLVERTRGTALGVEPIVASRFAPTPITEISSETEAPSPIRREGHAPEVSGTTNGTVVRREETLDPIPEKELVEKVTQVASETLLVPQLPPDDKVTPRATRTRRGESLRRDVLPHVQSAATVVRQTDSRSRRPTTLPNGDVPDDRPIVRVTIGRIDVRAAPAPAQVPRRQSRAEGPKLSLDAYLKERKEGAR